jgi:hypothetical protein
MQLFICSLLIKLSPGLGGKFYSLPRTHYRTVRTADRVGIPVLRRKSRSDLSRGRKFVVCDCGVLSTVRRCYSPEMSRAFDTNGGSPFLRPPVWEVQTCKSLPPVKMLEI